FLSFSNTLKKNGGAAGISPQSDFNVGSVAVARDQFGFNKRASGIGLRIHQTSQKIERLSRLTKSSSIFDDRSKENDDLTLLIKNDITSLNQAVTDLQALQTMEISDLNASGDRAFHLSAVCDDLKNRLMSVTKQFQGVLTTRTEARILFNIKAHENRKQLFSAVSSSRADPLNQTKMEPPPWSSVSSPGDAAHAGSQLRRRTGGDTFEVQQQVVLPRQEGMNSSSRAGGLQNVESTISELSGIFTHLATMVAHQGELAIRIDDSMDESVANVEGASNALLKYLNKVSSNRWLMIKVFLVLLLFLLIFIVLV
ncbi:t-snare sed 5, partial [Genlisea aurea]